MYLGLGHRAFGVAASPFVGPVLAAACALALAGCSTNGAVNLAATQPRGATVAFESIEGPPPGHFQTLVRNLNNEAQSRRLAVISRENASAYRVRGYLTAKVVQRKTTISWVWDVFDREQNRALRIEGKEQSAEATKRADAWTVADDAMLGRIAQTSMEQLAAFLTSPEASPPVAGDASQTAFVVPAQSSPEAAGIFRIFRAHADPLPAESAEPPAAVDEVAGAVPLPPHRPDPSAALVPAERVALASSAL